MRITSQKMVCREPGCGAFVEIRLTTPHDFKSTGAALEDFAADAGWGPEQCPAHRRIKEGERGAASTRSTI